MSDILGKWKMIEGQPFPGLWFEFKEDGTFRAEFDAMVKILSGGTYTVGDGGTIDMDQTQHTMNLIGAFRGLYTIEGDTLHMALSAAPGGDRPTDLSGALIYKRIE